MNPFYMNNNLHINNNGIDMGRVKQIYNMLKNSNDPNQLLNQMASQNPQLAQTINLIKSNGNYEQIFRSMCNERGINADEFIKNLNG